MYVLQNLGGPARAADVPVAVPGPSAPQALRHSHAGAYTIGRCSELLACSRQLSAAGLWHRLRQLVLFRCPDHGDGGVLVRAQPRSGHAIRRSGFGGRARSGT